MRLCGLDLESTGTEVSKDRIVEVGAVLWETETKRPLVTYAVFCHDETYPPMPEGATKANGITEAMLEEFGMSLKTQLEWLDGFCKKHSVEYLVAHNGGNFDRPLLVAELDRAALHAPTLRSLPWIDTRFDLPFATEPDSRKLKHLALDCGFINPFAHRAVFDVLTMLRVLSNYPIEQVLEYQRLPWVTVRAMVSYDDRQKAKDRGFSWEKVGDKTYPKQWVKRIKENLLEVEQKSAGFQTVVLKE